MDHLLNGRGLEDEDGDDGQDKDSHHDDVCQRGREKSGPSPGLSEHRQYDGEAGEHEVGIGELPREHQADVAQPNQEIGGAEKDEGKSHG